MEGQHRWGGGRSTDWTRSFGEKARGFRHGDIVGCLEIGTNWMLLIYECR